MGVGVGGWGVGVIGVSFATDEFPQRKPDGRAVKINIDQSTVEM